MPTERFRLQTHDSLILDGRYQITRDPELVVADGQLAAIQFRARDWGQNWQDYTVIVYPGEVHIDEKGGDGINLWCDTSSLKTVCDALLSYFGPLSSLVSFAVDSATFARLEAGSDLFPLTPQPSIAEE